MARSAIQNPNFQITGDVDVDTGREPVQLGWYEFAAEFCRGKDVLDVGCGMGEGLERLARTANAVRGIDLDERLRKPNVDILDIKDAKSKSADIVTCIDVIEHVVEDLDFVKELVRVARHEILVSTPNWVVSRCSWKYHVREYMPHEISNIFKPYGTIEMFKGNYDGSGHFKIKYPWAYSVLNHLRVFPLTSFLARLVNHFLPASAKIRSALFLRVRLTSPRHTFLE